MSFRMEKCNIAVITKEGYQLQPDEKWDVEPISGEGVFTVRDRFNTVRRVVTFKDGMLNGRCESYLMGCLTAVCNCINNVVHGFAIEYGTCTAVS